jgi:ABC-2 type transport system permease protein
MPNYLQKTARVFAATWSETLAYRNDVLLWTVAEAMVPLVALAVWMTVATGGNIALTPRETFTYYVLIFFARAITNAWVSFFLSQEILNGKIVADLVRPVWPFWRFIAENVTVKAVRLSIPLVLLLLTLGVAPQLFATEVFNVSRSFLAALSILLAMVLTFVFDSLFGLLAFWLEDSFQIAQFQGVLNFIASGILIPFAAMPPLLLSIFGWLPYRAMISTPVEIMMGQTNGYSTAQLITLQLVWLAIFIVVAVVMWQRGLRRYAVPGQ